MPRRSPPKSDGLLKELDALEPTLRARLAAAAFDPAWLVTRARSLRARGAKDRNRVTGRVRAPRNDEIGPLPEGETRAQLAKRGEDALKAGELALCVLAGGMATRMGSVVKALVEIKPGLTFLDARLAEQRVLSERAGRPVPLWLMTSDATDAAIRKALADRGAPAEVATFRQGMALRLDPEGRLFRDARGAPSTYATGHGDFVDAVRASGLLDQFRAAGGKAMLIANLDNLGATLDVAYAGALLASDASLLVEVCRKEAGDRGGVPVELEGRMQVLEEFRLPAKFDASTVPVFNTNTMWIRTDALKGLSVPWRWFVVEKQVDGRTAVQFERLLQELTSVLVTRYVEVPRHGEHARFLPVKDPAELDRRRGELEAVLRARGLLEA
jgi:UTP--glucose-1-phosphate uridylyltransferase